MSIRIEEILTLSVEERLEIVEEIWRSIVSDPKAIPLTTAQRKELDRRKREHRSDPAAATPWSEVHERLLKRKN